MRVLTTEYVPHTREVVQVIFMGDGEWMIYEPEESTLIHGDYTADVGHGERGDRGQ